MAQRLKPEEKRIKDARERNVPWRKWGPYLSERQWGTVREDYSANGDAWDYFSHDQARSRAYRWGEDGLAGISDDRQLLCFGLALWNGRDPIVKERLFGLTNNEGNHGEDVKEYYFYIDSTPTHSYMKYLYKYPQQAYPYDEIVRTNRLRRRMEPEYELIDTGVFDNDRYFDVFVEYAKRTPEEILVKISIHNRGPEAAGLHVLPSLWFRNTWSWSKQPAPKPLLKQLDDRTVAAAHSDLGERYLYSDHAVPWLFTENETNHERIFGKPNASPYVKDAINNYFVHGQREAVNPERKGTKAAAHYEVLVPAGRKPQVIWLLLSDRKLVQKKGVVVFDFDFERAMKARRREADNFYAAVIPSQISEDAQLVMRQAYAGLFWTKQFYHYAPDRPNNEEILPPDCERHTPVRNRDWSHLHCADVISMPDKWEYPWFAAWDLAFHCMALGKVDIDFAKDQLELMTNLLYLHPNGQLPAYEWNFSDVNPPVHSRATWQVYLMDKSLRGKGDRYFLEGQFHKLLMNFTWWVNRKDESGKNLFGGGFLGLDNIGLFDRSAPLPTGGTIEQADGTSWMAMYCLDMLTIALELALENPVYEELANKFFEHFVYIVSAMDRIGIHEDELWDEQDGFFYDVLRLPRGESMRVKVRSMVGLIPLFANAVYTTEVLERLPSFRARVRLFVERVGPRVGWTNNLCSPMAGGRHLLSPVDGKKLRRILVRMLDESEFLSPYGIRALSSHYRKNPYVFNVGREIYRVDYEPAESSSALFGGNSNWRGPIWLPVNALLVQSLRRMYTCFGDEFKVECPTGSGRWMNLWEVSAEITRRLCNIFLRDGHGRRAFYGDTEKFQTDPHWRDLILFYEYFHGDNGAGLGASHQTGWTALVASDLNSLATFDPKEALEKGFEEVAMRAVPSS